MTLATVQRGLRDLLRGRPMVERHPYLADVAASDRLDLLREIVLWWRAFGLERTSPLTAALLKRHGRFDETVSRFVVEQSISPYVEQLGEAFAAAHRDDPDELVATVASFEWALMRVKRGDPGTYEVDWPAEPYAVLHGLLMGRQLPSGSPGRAAYRTVVSAAVAGHFTVTELAGTAELAPIAEMASAGGPVTLAAEVVAAGARRGP